jgi:hypothetical protein
MEIHAGSSSKALLNRLDSSRFALSRWLLMDTTGVVLRAYSASIIAAWSATHAEMMMEIALEVMSEIVMSAHAKILQRSLWLSCQQKLQFCPKHTCTAVLHAVPMC